MSDQSPIAETHSDEKQTAQVLSWLHAHGSITPMDARSFGCDRLAARIFEIRQTMKVVRTMEGKGRNKYARYSLA